MRKSKSELWVRHLRRRNFETNRRPGVFYQEMAIKSAKEKAYFAVEELVSAYRQMVSTRHLFHVGRLPETEIKNLIGITMKWHFSVWGELFTVSNPNLSNRRILRYVKPTR